MVDEEPAYLVGRPNCGQQRQADVLDRLVRYADARIVAEVGDARNVGVVGERVEGGPRQVEEERVHGLVDQHHRASPKVVDQGLSGANGVLTDLAALFPVRTIGQVAHNERHRKGVLVRYRVRQTSEGLIDAQFRDRELSPPEGARYSVRRVVNTEALAQTPPVGARAALGFP